jgi:hypothetical protein
MVDRYPTKISKQTKIIDGAKTLITQLPQLRHLLLMQRDFVGKLQPFLMDVIVDNNDVYRDADSALSIKRTKRPISSGARLLPIATPSPLKQAKTDSLAASNNNTITPIKEVQHAPQISDDASTPSNSKSDTTLKYPFMSRAIGSNVDLTLDNACKVASDVVSMLQDNIGNNIELTYRDTRNGRMKSFIRVPKATSEKSFNMSIAWVKSAVKHNSGDGVNLSDSVRRVTKELYSLDQNSVLEALNDLGVNTVT